jgi:hypothetical protein
MRTIHRFGIGAVLLALALAAGCGNQQGTSPRGSGKAATSGSGKEGDHSHGTGPHGGVVFDLGGGTYHAEFTVDHPRQEATVHILGSDAKTATAVKADKLLLSIRKPQFQVELKAVPLDGEPKGKSSRFAGRHQRLGKEQEFAGTVSGEIDGTPFAGDFKEAPDGQPQGKK